MENCTSGFDASQRLQHGLGFHGWSKPGCYEEHYYWNEIPRQGDWPLNDTHFSSIWSRRFHGLGIVITFHWPLRFLHSTSGRFADGSSPTETGAGNRKGSEVRNRKAAKLQRKRVWRCFFLSIFSRRFISTHIRWNPFHPAIDFCFVTSVHFISSVVQLGSAYLIQHVTLVTDSCPQGWTHRGWVGGTSKLCSGAAALPAWEEPGEAHEAWPIFCGKNHSGLFSI